MGLPSDMRCFNGNMNVRYPRFDRETAGRILNCILSDFTRCSFTSRRIAKKLKVSSWLVARYLEDLHNNNFIKIIHENSRSRFYKQLFSYDDVDMMVNSLIDNDIKRFGGKNEMQTCEIY